MRVIIDRKEGNQLIVELEDGQTISVPETLIPDAREGMIFDILRNEKAEGERLGKVQSLFDKLKKG